MTISAEFVKCQENEGVKTIVVIPGEENLHVMEAFLDSSIEFITAGHVQGAAFMTNVYSRLTERVCVCLAKRRNY